VPDAESAEFMKEFYKGIFGRQSIGDAIGKAQNAMRNKYRNDLYKWAALVLVKMPAFTKSRARRKMAKLTSAVRLQ